MNLLKLLTRPALRRLVAPPAALLGLPLLLAGCETIIDVPEPAHTPRLTVSYILADTPLDSARGAFLSHRQLFISASQRLFDTSPHGGLSTATARLYDEAGTVVEEFRPSSGYGDFYGDTAGYYKPRHSFTGQPGHSYRLRVEAAGYEAVESTLTLPPAPANIQNPTFTARSSDVYQILGQLAFTVQDDPATTDYYVAFARVLDTQGQPMRYSFVSRDDNRDSDTDFEAGRFILSGTYGNRDVYPFADTDVNGQAITLNNKVRIDAYSNLPGGAPAGFVEVTISRLTPDAYKFWLSVRRYNDTDGNPFAEPAPIRSNITNGYGIFGGAVDAVVRIPL